MKTFLFLCGAALQFSSVVLAQNAPTLAPLPVLAPSNQPPVDYPGAIWVPAVEGNFSAQNRPSDEKIDRIVVHDIEGPAASAISIFQDKTRQVSSHYIVGGDGQIYQMVREHNVGFHAGNREFNHHSIGIETEGYSFRPGWYSPTIYEAEAKLVRDITTRYAIPRDRAHIIGHFEVPNPKDPTKFGGINAHTDPGPYWNWAAFMTLVRNDARLIEAQIPATIRPGEILPASVTLQNSGDDAWPVNTAADPGEELQASGPLIALGTEQGRISPLFNLRSWLGPALISSVKSEAAPGAMVRFDFTVRGPLELGEWSENLRLTTVPTAAMGLLPVSFGDKVLVTTRVVPYIIEVAMPDAAGVAVAGAPLAKWSARLPIGGIYAVYAAPPKPRKTRRQKPFSYRIDTLDGPQTVEAPPDSGGRGWLFAGYYRFPEASKDAPTIAITLQSAPSGIEAKNAGAIRLIGPFPAASLPARDLNQIPGALSAAPR